MIATEKALPTIADPSQWVVWIDLDDTLWDFKANSVESLIEVYEHFKLSRFWTSIDRWLDDYHEVNDALWRDLADEKVTTQRLRWLRFYQPMINVGATHAEATAFAEQADGYYLSRLGRRGRLVAGARELLDGLRDRGFRIGVLSNGFREVQYAKMESAGIREHIDFVVLSDDAQVSKPNVGIFRFAEQVAKVEPRRCIMIGDNGDTDIAGALRAGWPLAVWYNPVGRVPGEKLKQALSAEGCVVEVAELTKIKF